MAFGDADLDVFFLDAPPVIWASVTTKGWLDAPGQEDPLKALAGQVVTEYKLTYKTSALQGIKVGEQISVDGAGYTVRTPPEPIDDGKISHIFLKK